jgi:uncharacterized protein with HEPN domain
VKRPTFWTSECAARNAREFASDVAQSQFYTSRLHQSAAIGALEVIGEAEARLSDETRRAHPDISWADMTGMRNRLIHGYFEVDPARVWDTIQDDLPALIARIEPLVRPEEP